MVNHSFMGHGPKKKTYEIPCSPTLSGAASSYAPAPGRRLHCSAPAGRGTKEYKLAPVLVRQIIGKQCLGNFFLWIVATLLEPSRCGLAMLGERSKHANGSRHQGTSKPIWLMPRPMVIPGLKTSWAVVTPTTIFNTGKTDHSWGHSWGTGHHFSGGYWLNQRLRLYCLRCPLEIQEFKDSNWMISWKHARQGSKKGGFIHPPSVVESHFNSTFTYEVVPTIQWVEFMKTLAALGPTT